MFEKLTPQEITELVITVLLAYHTRESERIQSVINETGQKNRWHEHWQKFQKASQNNEQALYHFSQFIAAQLDGGDCQLPEGLTL